MKASFVYAAALTGLLILPAGASDSFYQGKTVTLIVGYGPGGGYDNAARLLARHLGRHIPGSPTVIVQNMEGAGSLRAANHVYAAAAQDGTVIAAVNQSLPTFALAGVGGVRFDPSKLNWLGSMQTSNSVLVTWKGSGVSTLADAKSREVPLGGSGAMSDSNIHAVAINELLGTRFKVVNGYKGARDIHLAMERGEVAGRAGITWSSIVAYDKPWISEKKINVLVQIGASADNDLPDVPMLQDLVPTPEHKQVVTVLTLPTVLGFAHWVGPAVPADRVAVLRAAYDATMRDPAFKDDAARTGLDISPKKSGAIEALVRDAGSTPKSVLERVGRMMSGRS